MSDETCGCCEGVERITPSPIVNRPGLAALSYRVGTHAAFLETMKAQLSGGDLPALAALKTRDGDAAIALLDAWATIADVLTFYQERIANEGYLPTATERRSVLELARLVGYALRPGVAATVYPAFTMEIGYSNGQIPAGTRTQSIPNPGEMPQFFETAEAIEARTDWNNLQPRLTRPHQIDQENATAITTLYFEGISTSLQPNDPLLLIFGEQEGGQVLRQVQAIEMQPQENRTKVMLLPVESPELDEAIESVDPTSETITAGSPETSRNDKNSSSTSRLKSAFGRFAASPSYAQTSVIEQLRIPPSRPPANASRLGLTPDVAYEADSDLAPQLFLELNPALKDTLYAAWTNTPITPAAPLQSVEVLQSKSAPFGANAPLKPVYDNRGAVQGYEEWAIAGSIALSVSLLSDVRGAAIGLAALSPYGNDIDSLQALMTITQNATTTSAQVRLAEDNPHFKVNLDRSTVQVSLESIGSTHVRFIHALPDREEVDFYVNDRLVTTLSRFSASDYLVVFNTGGIEVALRLKGQSENLLATSASNIGSGYYSIVATGIASSADELQQEQFVLPPLEDNLEPPEDNQQAQIRIINTVPDGANAGLNLTLRGQTQILPAIPSFLESSEANIAIPPGSYQIIVAPNAGQAFFDQSFNFESGTVYTLVLTGLVNREPRLTVTILDAAIRLADERFRLNFRFLEFDRVFRFIRTRTQFFAQIANGKSLTIPFAENQTTRHSLEGGTLIITGPTSAAPSTTIREETAAPISAEAGKTLTLDAQYDRILRESWVVIQRPDRQIIDRVAKTATLSKADYGISARATQLTLKRQSWLAAGDRSLDIVRRTTVYAQSEKLTLAEEAIDPTEERIRGDLIELDRLYKDLQPGRWLIVSGERADLGANTAGVKASELVMLAAVIQNVAQVNGKEIPEDTVHTFIKLAKKLSYQYKRDTVVIHGNVAKSTHGETRPEVLGSGEGSKSFQAFPLRQPPLTYLAAPTPIGSTSTLQVRVNDVLWNEVDSLVGLQPTDRAYTLKTEDDGQTTIVFGNGESGARLPTGTENIKAVYRTGIGKAGNVKAEQISQLASRPLGLKSVINPLPATGGADRESRDQARRNAPLAVMSLDRLVSVQDYADFARTFAGIGKASATALSNGNQRVVHLTIAGADDIAIDANSDLYRNLGQALRQLGDSQQPVQVDLRELVVLIISANVQLAPQYQWESVQPQIRQALLNHFCFDRRDLGQDVFLSEAISTMQQVPGVLYVDVDVFDSVSETEAADPAVLEAKFLALKAKKSTQSDATQPRQVIPVHFARREQNLSSRFLPLQLIQPAQLALLLPTQPLTLLLNPEV